MDKKEQKKLFVSLYGVKIKVLMVKNTKLENVL